MNFVSTLHELATLAEKNGFQPALKKTSAIEVPEGNNSPGVQKISEARKAHVSKDEITPVLSPSQIRKRFATESSATSQRIVEKLQEMNKENKEIPKTENNTKIESTKIESTKIESTKIESTKSPEIGHKNNNDQLMKELRERQNRKLDDSVVTHDEQMRKDDEFRKMLEADDEDLLLSSIKRKSSTHQKSISVQLNNNSSPERERTKSVSVKQEDEIQLRDGVLNKDRDRRKSAPGLHTSNEENIEKLPPPPQDNLPKEPIIIITHEVTTNSNKSNQVEKPKINYNNETEILDKELDIIDKKIKKEKKREKRKERKEK